MRRWLALAPFIALFAGACVETQKTAPVPSATATASSTALRPAPRFQLPRDDIDNARDAAPRITR